MHPRFFWDLHADVGLTVTTYGSGVTRRSCSDRRRCEPDSRPGAERLLLGQVLAHPDRLVI